ncbi:cobalamin-dependent protein [Halalkalibaculum sp. DA3122]|uniref:cobalamin-dependent protein n=1 Tax=Halalkalibaculum sp. DA3122 TaxID=3373607 RepID=UPI0037544E37
MKKYSDLIAQLEEQKHPLAERITALQFKNNPMLEERYGQEGRDRCREDAIYHLEYLVEALRVQSPGIFNHYLEWAHHMLSARNIPLSDLAENVRYIKQAVREKLPEEDLSPAVDYLDSGINHLKDINPHNETHLKPDNPLVEEAREYLNLLLNSKRQRAAELVDELVDRGVSVSDIYEHIFQATQYEVGVLWQRNEITVAHEHYCTAATQLIMSRLYPLIFSGQKKGSRLVACSVASELHEIGIRMVSDFFEMDGWDTYYMGSNMPDRHLMQSIREHEADLLAISVTLPLHIGKVEQLVDDIRSRSEFDHLKIMAGGYPFTVVPDLWERIGTDATARTARQAVSKANKLVN